MGVFLNTLWSMARIQVSRTMPASHDDVWSALADLSTHDRWMKDAESVEFESEQRSGIGTSMVVATRVGPFRTIDRMEVTDWVEGESISVVHTGLVTGTGTLSAKQAPDGTIVSWVEDLTFPWWLGGPITASLARPILAAIWRGNLERLGHSLST